MKPLTKAQQKAEQVEANKKAAYFKKATTLLGHLYRRDVLAEVLEAYVAGIEAEDIAATIAYRAPVGAATHPLKTAAVARATEEAEAIVERAKADLEKAGWNLSVLAPYPSGNMSRAAYQKARSKYGFFNRLTKNVSTGYSRPGQPQIVEMSEEGVARFIQDNKDAAAAQYDAFIVKLTGKVGEVVKAELAGNLVWSHSVLTVTKADGTIQKWKTQTILNQSVYGLVFNQYPTRLMK